MNHKFLRKANPKEGQHISDVASATIKVLEKKFQNIDQGQTFQEIINCLICCFCIMLGKNVKEQHHEEFIKNLMIALYKNLKDNMEANKKEK